MGDHKLIVSPSLSRVRRRRSEMKKCNIIEQVLDFSKSKDGLAAVSDMMSSMDPQVQSAQQSCCSRQSKHVQASKNLIADICALYGDLARMEQALLSNIPTTTVVDEMGELA